MVGNHVQNEEPRLTSLAVIEELSEEDEDLKNDLEMLVTRLEVCR